MQRRDLLLRVGASAAATFLAPLAAPAQPSRKLPTVGFLGATSQITARDWVAAFAQRMRELGWIDGKTVAIDYRWSDGRNERFAEIAQDFAQRKVAVIVTYGTAAIAAAMKATSDIPIVFALGANPVGTGLVKSLARPGGNVTGLATAHYEVTGKRIELLREIDSGLRRLAILANYGNPGSIAEAGEVRKAAQSLGIETHVLEVRRAEDVTGAIAPMKGKAEALYTVADGLLNNERVRINEAALDARLPTMHGAREFVTGGGLMSYGANFVDLFRRSGDHVDKILRGTKPADIPVELPVKFDLVVNLKTASALGLAMPPTLLTRANEVIE